MRRRGAGRSNNVLRTAGPTAPTQPNWFRISLLLVTALTIREAANAGEEGDRFLFGSPSAVGDFLRRLHDCHQAA